MPERWEHELRKLRELRPSEDLGDRVAHGPNREPAPPARQRVIAGITALVVFLAAGVLIVRAFGTGPEPQAPATGDETPSPEPDVLVLELRAQDGAPTGTLRFGDLEQRAIVDEYTWCVGQECTSMIADFVFYPPVNGYLVVPPGTPIHVSGDGAVERLRVLDPDGNEVEGEVGDVVPATDGRYVLAVEGAWSDGEETGSASMWFGVQTLSSPDAAPNVLEVDCSLGLARGDTAVVQTQTDGVHLRFVGTDGSTRFVIVPADDRPDGPLFSEPFQAGRNVFRLGLPPLRWRVACTMDDDPVEPADDTAFEFEVVDPGGHDVPSEVPDALVLRCEGLGPAVDSEVVRLQPDGLHVEATNLEFASAVVGIHSDEAAETMIVPFEEATERFVWDVPPGSLQIGCRAEAETGSEPADHLIEIDVLPAEG
jgi:hypothetical protein